MSIRLERQQIKRIKDLESVLCVLWMWATFDFGVMLTPQSVKDLVGPRIGKGER